MKSSFLTVELQNCFEGGLPNPAFSWGYSIPLRHPRMGSSFKFNNPIEGPHYNQPPGGHKDPEPGLAVHQLKLAFRYRKIE